MNTTHSGSPFTLPVGNVALPVSEAQAAGRTRWRIPASLTLAGVDDPGMSRLLFLLLVALGLRLLAMANLVLLPEEAYYWMYSQHPDLSYFDHPPMISWVIGLGTWLFGNTELGVRVMGHMLMLLAVALMYWYARTWFGQRAALWSAFLLLTLPVYFGIGLVATMDSSLLCFWLVSLCGVTLALKHGKWWGWYIAGVGLGAALLSKYTAIFLAAGAFATCVGHRPWRRHLATIHPYLAVVVGVAMFSPVILWNALHDWASFRFQFMGRFHDQSISVTSVLAFVAVQMFVITPVVFAGFLWCWGRMLRRWRRLFTPRCLFSLAFSVPLFLVMAEKSLRYDVNINWTAPLYLSALPWLVFVGLAALRLSRRHNGRFHRLCRFSVRGIAALLVVYCVMGVYLLLFQAQFGWVSGFGPWRELAAVVEKYEDKPETETGREPFVLADGKYRIASVLAFYRTPLEHDSRPSQFTTSQWLIGGDGLGYAYWQSPQGGWNDVDCVYVTDQLDGEAIRLKRRFESVEFVSDSSLSELGPFHLALCRGLRPMSPEEEAVTKQEHQSRKQKRSAMLDD